MGKVTMHMFVLQAQPAARVENYSKESCSENAQLQTSSSGASVASLHVRLFEPLRTLAQIHADGGFRRQDC